VPAETSKNMPKEWDKNETNINFHKDIAERPIRLTPNSSGKGEAIIKAPITGRVQEKYLVWTIL